MPATATNDPADELRKVESDVRRLCRRGQELGERLERGQAESPLSAHFEQLEGEAKQPELRVLLLTETAQSAERVLSWLGSTTAEPGAELTLEGAVPCTLLPVALEGLDLAGDGPRLAQDKDLLLLAGTSKTAWPDDLSELAEELAVVEPVLLLDDGEEPPRRGWWRERSLAGEASLSAVRVLSAVPPDPPGWLTDKRDPLRAAASCVRIGARLERGSELVVDRLELDQRQLKQRLATLDRREKSLEGSRDRDARGKAAPLRELIEKRISDAESQLEEANDRSLLETGSITSVVKTAVVQVIGDDLSEEEGARAIRLTLSPAAVARLTDVVQNALENRLKEDGALVRRHLSELEEALRGATAQAFGEPLPWAATSFDEKELWKRLTNVISLEVRYKGELPKRGFVERLAEGRRKVFMLLMTVSLMGGIFGGFSRRGRALGIVLLVFFVGASLWTYVAWKKEDAERLDRELEKARDALQSEMKRILKDAQREKLQRIKAYLSEQKKALVRQVDDQAKTVTGDQVKSVDEERKSVRATRKQNEQRLRDLDGQRRDVDRFKQETGDVLRRARRVVRDLARRTEASAS